MRVDRRQLLRGAIATAAVAALPAAAALPTVEREVSVIAPRALPTLLECDGRWLSGYDYPRLFAVLGHKFGGDGIGFKLPDLRASTLGLVPRRYSNADYVEPPRTISHSIVIVADASEEDLKHNKAYPVGYLMDFIGDLKS